MYKYRLELIFSFPFVSLLFVWYFRFAFSPDSPMQHPEGLYTEKKFILYLVFLAILVFVLLIVDIPIVKIFSENPIVHSF